MLLDHKIMYSALVKKDHSFEGSFIFGVKTTGIFCRPTCTARKPKVENVEYFSTTKEALDHGYRPCKVCRPMELYGETPTWIKGILKEIRTTPDIKLKDYDLKQRGVDPARIRRWFQKHHGITFHAYMRSLRINRAFSQIKHNQSVIDTALDNGYESLSGFHDAFKKTTGFSPTGSKTGNIVTITRILTPIGPMFAGATEEGICLLEFTDRRMLDTQIARLRKLLKAEFIPGENIHFLELDKQLKEYFDKKRKTFDLSLVIPGTEFQTKTWSKLQSIPYGETRTYQQQANEVGKTKAVRAVATANGDNRISIIIPCHRVIAKNGDLAGYGGGLWRKQYLLDLESHAYWFI